MSENLPPVIDRLGVDRDFEFSREWLGSTRHKTWASTPLSFCASPIAIPISNLRLMALVRGGVCAKVGRIAVKK